MVVKVALMSSGSETLVEFRILKCAPRLVKNRGKNAPATKFVTFSYQQNCVFEIYKRCRLEDGPAHVTD